MAFCDAFSIPFIADALNWEAGERKEVTWYGEGTGPWHDNLCQSTGFKPQKSKYPPIEENPARMAAYNAFAPHYDMLRGHRLGQNSA